MQAGRQAGGHACRQLLKNDIYNSLLIVTISENKRFKDGQQIEK
jgi:hypothetical protein